MKLNFMTDHGSIRDRRSCALRVDTGPLGTALAAATLGRFAVLDGFAVLGVFAVLASPGFGLAWNGAVTLAVIVLGDLSAFGGRSGLAAPVLDLARNEGLSLAAMPGVDGF